MSSEKSIRRRGTRQRGGTAVLLAVAAITPAWIRSGLAEAPRPPAESRTIVDPAVVPAGGCRGCNAPACRTCKGRHGVHHAGCRDGKCHPHCPVRPQEFGFYGTQWRRWPDRQVVPAAHVRAGTPALPPRSQIPRSEEESRRATEDTAVPQPEPPVDKAARTGESDPENTLDLAPENVPARRLPQPPRGEEDPASPLDSSGGPQPRLLPQSLRGDDGLQAERPRPLSAEQHAAAASRVAATPSQGIPLPPPRAIAPEPAPSHDVVTTAAEADEGIDESSLGPARRRFVARRLPQEEGSGAEAPAPASP